MFGTTQEAQNYLDSARINQGSERLNRFFGDKLMVFALAFMGRSRQLNNIIRLIYHCICEVFFDLVSLFT